MDVHDKQGACETLEEILETKECLNTRIPNKNHVTAADTD